MVKMEWPSSSNYIRRIDIDSLGRTLDENISGCPFCERDKIDREIAGLVNFPFSYMCYDPCGK